MQENDKSTIGKTNITKHDFDIVISGGGLSGALMALSLLNLTEHHAKPLSIAIVEANPILINPARSFDERVLALSRASVDYLAELAVWQDLKSQAEPIKNIHISDRNFYGKARFYAQDYHLDALGYVVEMSAIGAALLTKLKGKKQISWFAPDSIADIEWQSSQVNIQLSSHKNLTAKLLLACDGAQSQCRRLANIDTSTVHYQQSALITNVTTSIDHKNVAYERFTETGPIAMLPLSAMTLPTITLPTKALLKNADGDSHQTLSSQNHSRCSLVWTLPPEQAQQLQQCSTQVFTEQLQQAFGSWLGNITHIGKRVTFALSLVQAKELVYHRMALIGNAAHTIHPIAGQGFNLGLRDVQDMTQMIGNALEQQQDIGAFAHLQHYAVQRQQDQQGVIDLTDSLVTLFSNDLPPLVVGRNIALKALNYLTPIKNVFVKRTMGY